jgi:hypothetical protein
MKKKLFAAILVGALSPMVLAGDADMCLDCHEPAEDWEGMTADEIFAEARAPGNKRHSDNAELSDEQLKAAIAELLKK